MSDNIMDNANTMPENTDNMAQNENMEETLSTDIPVSGEGNEDEENEHGGGFFSGKSKKIEKLQGELDEQKDKYLRMVAEFDNFRRRTAKETLEVRQTAGKDIIMSLLVVMDDMDRAAKQLENTTDIAAIKEGVSLVFNKLRGIMQQKGLKVMETGHGEFNPDLHEAITEIPAPSADMAGKVIDTVEPGYYLNDKLIRHAKVVVGK